MGWHGERSDEENLMNENEQILNDIAAQIKAKDERIAELEQKVKILEAKLHELETVNG